MQTRPSIESRDRSLSKTLFSSLRTKKWSSRAPGCVFGGLLGWLWSDSGGPLLPPRGALGMLLSPLGRSWGDLGTLLGLSWPLLDPPKRSWLDFRSPKVDFGLSGRRFWDFREGILETLRVSRTSTLNVQALSSQRLHIIEYYAFATAASRCLERSWDALGPLLLVRIGSAGVAKRYEFLCIFRLVPYKPGVISDVVLVTTTE